MFTPRMFATVVCMLVGCNANHVAQNQKVEKIKEPLATLDGHVALDFSPDNKWLAIGAELVDTSTWKVAAMLEERISDKNPTSKNHWGYTSAAFSPDSKKLAIGDQDGSLRILEVPSMVLTKEFLAHGARITGIGFGNDNETVVTTSVDEYIRMWNSRTGEELFRSGDLAPKVPAESIAGFFGAVDIFALSPNRELFAAADITKRIVIGSMRDGKIVHEFKGPGGDKIEMDSLAFSFDSSKLLVGVTPKVYVYNVIDASVAGQIEAKADSTLFVKSINESGLIAMYYRATGSKMAMVEFYDMAQAKSLGAFVAHQSRGAFWSVSGDGRYIATTGHGGPVRIWSVTEAMRDLVQSSPPAH